MSNTRADGDSLLNVLRGSWSPFDRLLSGPHIVIWLALTLFVAGCGDGPRDLFQQGGDALAEYFPANDTSIPPSSGSGIAYANNLTIRIDAVQVLESDADLGLGGEAIFSLIAIRRSSDASSSAKLVAPGKGSLEFRIGDLINLGDYSLQLNNIQQDEDVQVYFIGLETDDLTEEGDYINAFIDVTAGLLLDFVLPLEGSLTQLAASNLQGALKDWWNQQEVLGEYSFRLTSDENWRAGEQLFARTTNGNLELAITVMPSSEVLPQPDNVVNLTIVNETSHTIRSVYISKSSGNSLLNKVNVRIRPGQHGSITLEPDVYSLRAESDFSIYWEIGPVDLMRDQEWVISD